MTQLRHEIPTHLNIEDKALFGRSADVFVGCLRLAKVQRNVAEARKILQPEIERKCGMEKG